LYFLRSAKNQAILGGLMIRRKIEIVEDTHLENGKEGTKAQIGNDCT
jgi:hypothetical protein